MFQVITAVLSPENSRERLELSIQRRLPGVGQVILEARRYDPELGQLDRKCFTITDDPTVDRHMTARLIVAMMNEDFNDPENLGPVNQAIHQLLE